MVAKNIDIEQVHVIGRNIDRLLTENNMTQAQLAEVLQLSESAIGKWILGKNAPSMGNIQKIADYFNVLVSDIVDNKATTRIDPKRKYLMDKIAKADDKKLSKFEKLMELIDEEESRDY